MKHNPEHEKWYWIVLAVIVIGLIFGGTWWYTSSHNDDENNSPSIINSNNNTNHNNNRNTNSNSNTNTNASSTGLANPASTYCVDQGGEVVIIDEAEGQIGYCQLENNDFCEEWDYFQSAGSTCISPTSNSNENTTNR